MATLVAGSEEQKRATLSERALFEEKIAKLTEQFAAESAARLFAEGPCKLRGESAARDSKKEKTILLYTKCLRRRKNPCRVA
jgi:hypothetical protein